MIKEKRNRNPPKLFFIQESVPHAKQKIIEKKRRLSEDNYAVIGLPPKYSSSSDVYLLPGNVPLSQRDGSFVTDLSWLNEFHAFREVEIVDDGDQKNLVIQVERRTDSRFPRLKNFVNKLAKARKPHLRQWGKPLKSFCQNCKKFTKQAATNQQPKSPEIQIKLEIKEEPKDYSNSSESTSETQNKETFLKECSIQLKSYFRGSETRLTQIIVNESLIQMLGYNTQTFSSHVLTEGLPEIFAAHEESNSRFLLAILEELSELNPESTSFYKRTSILEAPIKAKSGYVKNVKVQVHFMISYQNDRFESDTFFHIIDQGSSYFFPQKVAKENITQDFLEAKDEIEQQANRFLQVYYNQSILSTYANFHRVCNIKEL